MDKVWSRREQFGNLQDDANWERLVMAVAALPPFKNGGYDSTKFYERVSDGPRGYSSLFRSLIIELNSDDSVNLFGEKTPPHIRYIREISNMLPGSRFIHIVRDPRGVVNSMRSVPWSSGSLSLDAHTWCSALRSLSRLPQELRMAVKTVRYEDLVQEPELTLSHLCDFLSLPFDTSMLNHYQKTVTGYNLETQPWLKNTELPVFQEAATRWQRELTSEEICQIEAVTWRAMRSYGYEPVSSTARLAPNVILDLLVFSTRRIVYRMKQWYPNVGRFRRVDLPPQ